MLGYAESENTIYEMIESISIIMCHDILIQINQDIDDNYAIGVVQMYLAELTGDEALIIVNIIYKHLLRHLANVIYDDFEIFIDNGFLIIEAVK